MSFFGEGFGHEAISGFWDTSMGSHVLLLVGYQTSRGGGITFVFLGSCHFLLLKILKLTFLFCLFACRIVRGQEETSTSQAGRRRGTL